MIFTQHINEEIEELLFNYLIFCTWEIGIIIFYYKTLTIKKTLSNQYLHSIALLPCALSLPGSCRFLVPRGARRIVLPEGEVTASASASAAISTICIFIVEPAAVAVDSRYF